MGKTIVINLNTNSISEMPTPAEHYGRGLAMKLVRQYAEDGCSRLDEGNALAIVCGLLTGTNAPCANRASVAAMGNNAVAVSSISGDFPQKLASLGIDALVLTGKYSDGNAVIMVETPSIRIEHMPQLQGKSCNDIVEYISFPPMLLAILLVSMLGPSLNNAILAIALAWWPWYTRIVRGQAISLKERKFIQAAETIGTPKWKIVAKHIIPNTISPVVVQASMDMGGVILTIASLSYLGLGAQAPSPEWGLMISTSRNYFPDIWWYSVFPGLAIFITVLAFNLLGDGVREILDPKTRKK